MLHTFLCDSHIHSKYSFDSNADIYNIYRLAQKRNLDAITITDHFDCCDDLDIEKEIKSYKKRDTDINRINALFNNRLKLFKGIEIGQPLDNLSGAKRMLKEVNFDFTLLSLHNLTNEPDFYYLDRFEEDYIYSTLNRYFNSLLQMISFNDFDALAHLTYPLRYIIPKINYRFNKARFTGKIDMILTVLVQKNKALEINSSGLRQTISETLPSFDIVKRFRNLGGKYITVGSDAHSADDIGAGIRTAMLTAARAGFEKITVYERHIPITQRISL